MIDESKVSNTVWNIANFERVVEELKLLHFPFKLQSAHEHTVHRYSQCIRYFPRCVHGINTSRGVNGQRNSNC